MTATHAPPRADARGVTRARRMAGPLATLGGVAAATAYVRFVDPNQPGHYPMCPTLALFGIDCPGCGGLRATHALANGDVLAAMDHNLLFVAVIPLLAVMWIRWTWQAWSGTSPSPSQRDTAIRQWVLATVLVAAGVFTVLRNLVPYLGSGIG
jgi:hypothetical protein